MTVRVYKSSDAGAPQLSSTADTLIDVLTGCLVTGYGSKTAAGWTRPYNDTNVAVFKQGGTSPKHSHYLRVEDVGGTSARVVGYETMSDANTGTNPFPDNLQLSGGLYWYKPISATTRPWMVFATERTFYIWWVTDGGTSITGPNYNFPTLNNSGYNPMMYMFGDFVSFDPGEKYSCIIIGNSSNASSTGAFATVDPHAGLLGSTIYATHFVSRPSVATSNAFNRANASAAVTKCYSSFGHGTYATIAGSDTIGTHPYYAQNKIYFSRVWIVETTLSQQTMRGELPGIYMTPLALYGVEDTHTLTSANFPGKTLMCKTCRVASSFGYVYVETSDTW